MLLQVLPEILMAQTAKNVSFIRRNIPHRIALILLTVIVLSPCLFAQTASSNDWTFSPALSQKFYDLASDISYLQNPSDSEVEQAVVFLAAASKLDIKSRDILPAVMKIVSIYPQKDYSQIIYKLLVSYVDSSANLAVVADAVQYLLEKLDTREQREQLLNQLRTELGKDNPALTSELDTLLALLLAEKSDIQAATAYFLDAFNKNNYNKLAFDKIKELIPNQITPVIYLSHLRLMVTLNPYNINAAFAYAQYAKQLQLYDLAANTYSYCHDLFQYLYPGQPVPESIYVPWSISCYNTAAGQNQCLKIVSEFRQSNRLNLILEAVAAKAAEKTENKDLANTILKSAQEKALKVAEQNKAFDYTQLAWFYCFASPDFDKAIIWANKAYAADPNSTDAAAILAYCFVKKGQKDIAEPLLKDYRSNQISEITYALIQLESDSNSTDPNNSPKAVLRSAISKDPATLEAEIAKNLLTEKLQTPYLPPLDPNTVITSLKAQLSCPLTPTFLKPQDVVSFQLNLRGSAFMYGSDFVGSLVITNKSQEPIVVSDDGFFNGNIRIDAGIKGDIEKNIPQLLSFRVRPSSPVMPKQTFMIPLKLSVGQLKTIISQYPQASLNIEFTMYIDPVTVKNGQLADRLSDISPVKKTIQRPGIKITTKYLQNQINSMSNEPQGQKIMASDLFAGLLMEEYNMANREPLYKFAYKEWMPDMLKSALIANLSDKNWIVRANTLASLYPLPLDYSLTKVVSNNLQDSQWPVRLLAVAVLSKNQSDNFSKVRQWIAKHDSDELVKHLASVYESQTPPK